MSCGVLTLICAAHLIHTFRPLIRLFRPVIPDPPAVRPAHDMIGVKVNKLADRAREEGQRYADEQKNPV